MSVISGFASFLCLTNVFFVPTALTSLSRSYPCSRTALSKRSSSSLVQYDLFLLNNVARMRDQRRWASLFAHQTDRQTDERKGKRRTNLTAKTWRLGSSSSRIFWLISAKSRLRMSKTSASCAGWSKQRRHGPPTTRRQRAKVKDERARERARQGRTAAILEAISRFLCLVPGVFVGLWGGRGGCGRRVGAVD